MEEIMVDKEAKKYIFICDSCSANFTVEELREDRTYHVNKCPFCAMNT
jgi:DNA-directed RNA polymerase subunit RPC12/RpoP